MPANRKIPSQFEPQSHDGMSKFPYVPHVAKIVTFIYANIYQSNEIIRLEKFQHRPKPRGQRSQLPERTRGAYGFEMCGILCGFILSIFGYSNAHVLYMQYIYIYLHDTTWNPCQTCLIFQQLSRKDLMREAAKARLRRRMAVHKKKTAYNVPQWVREQWQTRDQNTMANILINANWDKDWLPATCSSHMLSKQLCSQKLCQIVYIYIYIDHSVGDSCQEEECLDRFGGRTVVFRERNEG